MDAHDAIDLGREAMLTAITIGAPMLAAAIAVGLVIGLAQAVTQIQEQSLSFVPKLVVLVVVLSLTLPWMIDQMTEYSRELIISIPSRL